MVSAPVAREDFMVLSVSKCDVSYKACPQITSSSI